MGGNDLSEEDQNIEVWKVKKVRPPRHTPARRPPPPSARARRGGAGGGGREAPPAQPPPGHLAG